MGFVVLFTGAPVMACMLPDAQLTVEESECCEKMAHRCGEMGMDPSHSCCTKVIRSDSELMASGKQFADVQISTLAVLPQSLTALPALDSHRLAIEVAHSPPEAPPSSISILRI
jgi:hypothetical protein